MTKILCKCTVCGCDLDKTTAYNREEPHNYGIVKGIETHYYCPTCLDWANSLTKLTKYIAHDDRR